MANGALIPPQNNGIPIGATPTPGGALGNLGPGSVRPAMPRSLTNGSVRPSLPQNLPNNNGVGYTYQPGSHHYYHRPVGTTIAVGATTKASSQTRSGEKSSQPRSPGGRWTPPAGPAPA